MAKRKIWILIAVVVVVLALVISLVAILGRGSGPRGYVAGHYQRAAALDIRGEDDDAYLSPKPPPVVEREITARWRPQSRAADTTGIYLRYPDDAVIIQPRGTGSEIHVMDVDRAYRRYHSHVGHTWIPVPIGGGTFRGRGPGSGK